MEKVVIFGASSGTRVLYSLLAQDSPCRVVGFTVDQKYLKEREFCGLPVVPFEEVESIYPPTEYKMLVPNLAIRVNKVRAEKYLRAKARGYRFISYVSSRATTCSDLVMGENCYISDFVVCRPSVNIGNNVMVMSGAFLGSECVIKDHCYIAGRATVLGQNTIESYCFIGANSTVLEGVTVASECVIGAGGVIHADTKEKGVYRVNPPSLLPLPSDKLGNILFRGPR